MKALYELPRDCRIDVSHLRLKYSETNKEVKQLNFHHIDGAYSYCTDDDGNVIHLNASTEVRRIEL